MKVSRWVPLAGVGFLLISLLGCTTESTSLDSALVHDGDSATLIVADLIPDGTDSLMLVCPYATVDSLADLSGRVRDSFRVRDAQLPGNDDGSFALLTVDGDAVEFFHSYSRTPIDLCGGDATSGDEVTSTDRLDVTSANGGKTWTL